MTKNKQFFLNSTATIILGFGVFTADEVGAQDSEFFLLEEIVVTATKRPESQQDIAIAATVFSEKTLEHFQFFDNVEIGPFVPGVDIRNAGTPVSNIFVRGVGNNDFNLNASSAVGTIIDEVFIQNSIAQNVAVFDTERVEILKGPQGTLFGKNTSAGVISYNSRRPDFEGDGFFSATYGRFNALRLEGAAEIPIIDNVLSVRFAGLSIDRDGTAVNLFDGQDQNDRNEFAARAMIRYRPTEATDILLSASVRNRRSDLDTGEARGLVNPATGLIDFDAFNQGDRPRLLPGFTDVAGVADPEPDEPLINASNLEDSLEIDDLIVSLSVEQDLGSSYTLNSISAYVRNELVNFQDADSGVAQIGEVFRDAESDQFSQEVRLSSNYDGPFQFITGVYYLREEIDNNSNFDFFRFAIGTDSPFAPFAAFVNQNFDQTTDSFAAFGDASYNITDKLSVSFGIRFTTEEREFSQVNVITDNESLFEPELGNTLLTIIPQTDLDETFNEFSGRFAIDYKPTEDILLYGTVSRGFRTGGFTGGALLDPAELTSFDPEILWAYEVGIKSDLFNRRVRLNAAAFFYDFSDLQVFSLTPGSTGTAFVQTIDNASDARLFGGELEITAFITNDFEFQFGLAVLDSEYQDFVDAAGNDFSGNELISAPNFELNASAIYTLPINQSGDALRFRLDASHTAERFFDASNQDRLSGAPITLVNASIAYEFLDGQAQARIFANNVFDEVELEDAVDLAATGVDILFNTDPRTFGGSLSFRF